MQTFLEFCHTFLTHKEEELLDEPKKRQRQRLHKGVALSPTGNDCPSYQLDEPISHCILTNTLAKLKGESWSFFSYKQLNSLFVKIKSDLTGKYFVLSIDCDNCNLAVI